MLLAACSPSSGTMRGVVVGVDGTLDEVAAFSMLVEGDVIELTIVPDGDYEFPPSHLREHLRTGEPVLAGWEERDGIVAAVTLDDG